MGILQRNFLLVLVVLMSTGFLIVNQVSANNRVLLVGVGKLKNPDWQDQVLTGIDIDLQKMRETVLMLGYEQDQIKELKDEQATYSNVVSAMQQWLVKGVTEESRVLIYFSTHGVQIPDQDGDEVIDKVDEALVLYDTEEVFAKNNMTLSNAIVDDEFEKFIDKIPSNNIMVVVDACHSGTATKAIGNPKSTLQDKSLFLSWLKGLTKFGFRPNNDTAKYALFSAADDHEKAKATPEGSLFTLGLHWVVSEAVRQNYTDLTAEEARPHIKKLIDQNIGSDKPYTPQLYGNKFLIEKSSLMLNN